MKNQSVARVRRLLDVDRRVQREGSRAWTWGKSGQDVMSKVSTIYMGEPEERLETCRVWIKT